ncbi:glycosyltransferase [Weissella soli]|uniref:glycosyltransferase n=1 Tax=Weissella soli TaxID=155866 RepID=UPI003C70A03D
MIKVSVLTTVYNETWMQVLRAINSVEKQVTEELSIEHIIVVDNPTYQYRDNLYSLRDQVASHNFKIMIIENSTNRGLATSLNIAIDASTSDILARLDADDWMNDNRLNQQLTVLQLKHADIVYTDTLLFTQGIKQPKYIPSSDSGLIKKALPISNFISHSSVMFWKPAITEVGMYRHVEPAEDYDLWLRLRNKNKIFAYIDKPLTSREVRNDSISNSNLYYQIMMARFVRRINRTRQISQTGISDVPKNLSTEKLHKINRKIKNFRSAKGIKKVLLGILSGFILRTSLNDVYFRIVVFLYKVK